MRRGIKFRIITFILGLLILVVLIYHAGFDRFLDQILHASPYFIALSVVVYATSWIFRTVRLEVFTKHAGKNLKMFELFKLYIAGYALNVLLPAKLGDVATVGFLKMKGINVGRSAAIIIQTRVLDVLALTLLSLPALAAYSFKDSPYWIKTAILVCFLIVAAPIGVVNLDKKKRVRGFFDKIMDKISHQSLKLAIEKIKEAYDAYHEIVSNKKLLLASILLSLVIWLFDGVTCYTVAVGFGSKISFLVVVLAVSIGNVGKSAPATPGSVGIYESLVAAVLVFFGMSFDIAIAVAILDHAIKNIFTLLLGIPATLNIGVNLSQLKEVRYKKDNN
jgi:uncharacterized protein (TIRG00374 family)